MVVHTCGPSPLGRLRQEDHLSSGVGANLGNTMRPHLKNRRRAIFYSFLYEDSLIIVLPGMMHYGLKQAYLHHIKISI
jgi:hypothetical protein